jgi:acylphosphatase
MSTVRVRVRIEGWVQGVFFRASTRDKARELGVNGWVRNLRDGSVECLIEGEQAAVEALVQWCRRGPPGARVEDMTTHWEEYRGDVQGFSIRY